MVTIPVIRGIEVWPSINEVHFIIYRKPVWHERDQIEVYSNGYHVIFEIPKQKTYQQIKLAIKRVCEAGLIDYIDKYLKNALEGEKF